MIENSNIHLESALTKILQIPEILKSYISVYIGGV